MTKRTWFAAVCVIALALVAAASAEQRATLVMRSGERIGGELVDMGADFTFAVNGESRRYPINDVALIDFVSGGRGFPPRSSRPSRHLVI